MKTLFKLFLVIGIISLVVTSCKKDEEDEGEELKISFKTSAGYTYADATLPGGTAIKVGIEAETEKAQDPIIKFNISESVNGATPTTVYSEDLENTTYEYDYNFTLNTVSGNEHKYTFTITNRDGLNEQKSITFTVE
ncbi:MAG TPA: hypothetical protein P5514_09300 [Bacteroidales bacterium]|nr:hypothetical protein [Bacteroidales bacterium]HRX97126.1 hypothetical protein [Bacteroidales bacterium]